MLRADVGRAGLDKAKSSQAGTSGRSRLLAASPATRGRHAPFSGSAKHSSVSVVASAASSGGAAASGSAPGSFTRTPRVAKTYTVQLENLKAGDELDGKVVKIEEFGCFVDVGAATNGLVHVSQLLGAGFVKAVRDVVKEGQECKVTVLSVDVGKNRLALSMKASKLAGGSSDEDDSAPVSRSRGSDAPFDLLEPGEEMDTDDEEDFAEEDEMDSFDIPEDQQAIFPEELDGAFFLMPRDDAGLTDAALTDYETSDEAYEYKFEYAEGVVPLPMYERLTGKVVRVENSGAAISFASPVPGARALEGFLHISEMKAPASSLTEEELLFFEPEEETDGDDFGEDDYTHNEYVDVGEVENATKYYKVGDDVTVFYIGSTPGSFGKPDSINFSQFTDAELLGAGVSVGEGEEESVNEDGDFEADEETAADFAGEELAALGPLRILEEEDALEAAGPAPVAVVDTGRRRFDDEEVEEDEEPGNYDDISTSEMLMARSSASSASLLMKKGGAALLQIQSRGLRRGVDLDAMTERSSLALKEEDFELDECDLQDYWTSILRAPVPKNAMKKAGYRLVQAADGSIEEVKFKDVPASALLDFSLDGDMEERAAEFLADLMSDDEDEAEIPLRAYRRVGVHAAAVVEVTAALVKSLRVKTGAGMMDCKKALVENAGDMIASAEWLRKKGLSGAEKKAGRIAAEGAVSAYIHPGSRLGVLLEINCETDFVAAGEAFQRLVSEVGMVAASSPDVTCVSPEDVSAEEMERERAVEMGREDLQSKPEAVRSKIVEGRLDKIRNTMALLNQPSLRDINKTVGDIIKETVAAVGENIKVRRFTRFSLGEGMEKRNTDFAAEVAQQTQAKVAVEAPKPAPVAAPAAASTAAPTLVAVSAADVKVLRRQTGAGMMDCKRALAECNNDNVLATEWLRKKGLSGADKKAGRIAAEGVVASYIHPGSRLGVLLEVNCETDFVGASDKFQTLVKGLAMQIAASPQVQYVSADEIPAEVFERERVIEMGREDIKAKPEAIREKIAEGRAKKITQDMALLEQPYLMDLSKTVSDAVKEATAAIGEKISVRRFVRIQLGEGLEKRSTDFAAEVAAVTGVKA